MSWYIKVLKNYVGFSGRAHRKEFWMFVLINFLISMALSLIDSMVLEMQVLGNIYSLGVLLPSLAVNWRRMHDTGRAGWWCLIPIAGLIFACTAGDSGPNEYGDDPYAEEMEAM